MLLSIIPITFVLFWTSCSACEINKTCDVNIQDKDVQVVMKGIDNFTNILIQASFNNNQIIGNPSFSPVSVYFGLLLVLIGSAGASYTQLAQVFALGTATQDQVVKAAQNVLNGLRVWKTLDNWPLQQTTIEELDVGLGVFLSSTKNFANNFPGVCQTLGADCQKLDFQTWATTIITNWIYSHTGKGYPFIFAAPIDPSAILIIATAIFFKAQWQPQLFTKNFPQPGTFRSSDGKEFSVWMMTTAVESLFFYDSKEKGYSVVQLPYQADFAMLVVLPYENADLSKFVTNLTTDEYKVMVQNMKQIQVQVTIPMITYGWKLDVTAFLEVLGLKPIIDGLDLSGMIEGGTNEKVFGMYHGAGLSINQYGTTVAEVSSANIDANAKVTAQNDVMSFIANRPFVVLIRHIQSGIICFTAFVKTFPNTYGK